MALQKLAEAETGQDVAGRSLGEAVEHSMNRHRQGLAGCYEVLEAEQQPCFARSTLAQIRGNRLLAYAQLCQALGVGWSLRDEGGRASARPTRTA